MTERKSELEANVAKSRQDNNEAIDKKTKLLNDQLRMADLLEAQFHAVRVLSDGRKEAEGKVQEAIDLMSDIYKSGTDAEKLSCSICLIPWRCQRIK